jgi:FkbM family methyltransferase
VKSEVDILSNENAHPARGEALLRGLHRVLPLGRKYHPLFSLLNERQGLISVPFDHKHVVSSPAGWAKHLTELLLLGMDVIPEFSVLAPICRRLQTGCLVDVGANIGLYTLSMRCESALPIIAYEPQPFLFRLLSANIARNRLRDVEVRNLACGSRKGTLPFGTGLNGSVVPDISNIPAGCFYTGNWPQGDLETEARVAKRGGMVIDVPVVTLDENLADVAEVALLKIDCEGFEYDVLQGAQKLIERHAPQLFIELHPQVLSNFGHSAAQVVELLSPHYDLEFWCFQPPRSKTKLGRSLARFRKPKAHRYANTDAMLRASASKSGPSQIFAIGHPRKRAR